MIRTADVEDAEEFCSVIRSSIIELCKLDHQNNKKVLDDWLQNKTVKNCQEWITSNNSNSFVAELNAKIVGVAVMGHNGHLYLCYVLPEVKGKGIGRQLLQAAEHSVLHLDLPALSLESTITAKGFYEHYGYRQVGKTEHCLKYTKAIESK